MQQAGLPLGTHTSPIGVQVRIPAISLLLQLLANAPRRAADNGSKVWIPAPSRETRHEF